MLIKELGDAAPLLENDTISDVAAGPGSVVIATTGGKLVTGGDNPLITGQNCGERRCALAVVLDAGEGPLQIEVGYNATFVFRTDAPRADYVSKYVEDELHDEELLVAGAHELLGAEKGFAAVRTAEMAQISAPCQDQLLGLSDSGHLYSGGVEQYLNLGSQYFGVFDSLEPKEYFKN